MKVAKNRFTSTETRIKDVRAGDVFRRADRDEILIAAQLHDNNMMSAFSVTENMVVLLPSQVMEAPAIIYPEATIVLEGL